MATAPELKIKVGADTSSLEKGLASSNRTVTNFAMKATAALMAVKTATFALGVASMKTIDAQAKLAQSLNTTTESIQILDRAGSLAGVSMSGVEQATKDLTRRLSQAAGGTGPAVDALNRLGLTAGELSRMPLDERISKINDAIEKFIPSAEQAAVAGQLFGEEGSIAMSRIDTATIRQASQDIIDFGVAVSEADAAKIQKTNDALSRLSLITTGLGNRIAADVAPALERFADIVGDLFKKGSRLTKILKELFDRVPAYTTALLGIVGAIHAYRAIVILATYASENFKKVMKNLGMGALVVVIGETVFWLMKLVKGMGGIGNSVKALKNLWSSAWLAMQLQVEGVGLKIASNWVSLEAKFSKVIQSMRKKWAELIQDFADWAKNDPILKWLGVAKNVDFKADLARAAVGLAELEIDKLEKAAEKLASAGEAKLKGAAVVAKSAWSDLKDTITDALAAADETPPSSDYTPPKITLGPSSGGPPSITTAGSSQTATVDQSGTRGSSLLNIEGEVERLRTSLMTAEELQIQSFERQKATLDQFLQSKVGGYGEHARLMERIESTHQFAMQKQQNNGVKGTLSALGEVFQGSKKMGAAIAVTNSWLAFTEVLKDPSFVGNPAGRMAAAAAALASGFNAVRSIKSGGKGTAGAGGGGAAASAGGGGGASGGNVSRNVAIRLEGDVFGQEQIRGLINQINEAVEGGALVRLV